MGADLCSQSKGSACFLHNFCQSHVPPCTIIYLIFKNLFSLFKKRLFFLIFLIFFLLEKGEGREKEEEKHQCVSAFRMLPTVDLSCNPGLCPDWEIEPATLWFTGQHSVH